MKKIIIFMIIGYQKVISMLLGPNCRFHPTCSEYSKECFKRFSFLKAIWYSMIRIIKCNPLYKGGFDPVPKK